jgi:hypothetical protein
VTSVRKLETSLEVFTLPKLADTTNQDFFFISGELVVNICHHTTDFGPQFPHLKSGEKIIVITSECCKD